MQAWWNSLSSFQQIMFVVAATSTLVLLIFLILMLIGYNGPDAYAGDVDLPDFELDIDNINDEPFSYISGLRLLSIRSILAFLSIGGWVAYVLDKSLATWLAGILGILSGAVAAFLVALAFKALYKLEDEGNIDYNNALGKTANVYLRIPPKRNGKGKVNVVVQGKYVEIDAVTDDEEHINTGSEVKIISLLDDTTVVVKRFKEE